MQCTEAIRKCTYCKAPLTRGTYSGSEIKILTFNGTDLTVIISNIFCKNALFCRICCALYQKEDEKVPICGGEVQQVTQDGKVIDCKCSVCGKSYGKHFLDPSRIRFVESFNAIQLG